jgi:hypothetical protein
VHPSARAERALGRRASAPVRPPAHRLPGLYRLDLEALAAALGTPLRLTQRGGLPSTTANLSSALQCSGDILHSKRSLFTGQDGPLAQSGPLI